MLPPRRSCRTVRVVSDGPALGFRSADPCGPASDEAYRAPGDAVYRSARDLPSQTPTTERSPGPVSRPAQYGSVYIDRPPQGQTPLQRPRRDPSSRDGLCCKILFSPSRPPHRDAPAVGWAPDEALEHCRKVGLRLEPNAQGDLNKTLVGAGQQILSSGDTPT